MHCFLFLTKIVTKYELGSYYPIVLIIYLRELILKCTNMHVLEAQ